MKTTILAGLAGLSILFAAGGAMAQDKPSVDTTTIAELADKPETKAILDKDLPGLTAHPAFEQFKGMTLKALQPMSGGNLTDEQIAAVQADLDALSKDAKSK